MSSRLVSSARKLLAGGRDRLSSLSREELVHLLASADQLLARADAPAAGESGAGAKHPLEPAPAEAAPGASTGRKKRRGEARPFDMSRYGQRWVALRVAYIGTRYHGMQYAEGVETVEGVLFEALTKTRLIADRDSCGFSRGGRTDRGVSALGQVVALRVRSSVVPPPAAEPPPTASAAAAGGESGAGGGGAAASGDGVAAAPAEGVGGEGAACEGGGGEGGAAEGVVAGEMDYVRVLNRVLPPDVRVVSWAPAPAELCSSHLLLLLFSFCRDCCFRWRRTTCTLLLLLSFFVLLLL